MAQHPTKSEVLHAGDGSHTMGHERSDIAVGTVRNFLIGLIVGGVILVILLGFLWRWFEATDPSGPSVSAFSGPRELPPTPRLQVTPERDLDEYLELERKRLTEYGWTDQGASAVHIPVERAIDLLAERGLPARAPAAGAPTQAELPRQVLKGRGQNPNEPKAQ